MVIIYAGSIFTSASDGSVFTTTGAGGGGVIVGVGGGDTATAAATDFFSVFRVFGGTPRHFFSSHILLTSEKPPNSGLLRHTVVGGEES